MDTTEMFMDGQTGGKWAWPGQADKVEIAQITPQHLMHAQFQMYHGFKWVARALFVFLVILVIVSFVKMGPYIYSLVTKGWWSKVDHFSQKEGLQWLGASADVIRGDLENNQDSLADKALKNDARVTDMSAGAAVPAKAGFRSRERLSTPEDEALKKMGQ